MHDDEASLGEIKIGGHARSNKKAQNRGINEALRTTMNFDENVPGKLPADPTLCESGEG
jgi:hypothetical protein